MKCLLRAWLWAFVAAGCPAIEPPQDDVVPPTVAAFEPEGEQVAWDASAVVRFSEPVSETVPDEGLVLVIETALIDTAWLQDLDNPPLSSAHAKLVLPAEATLAPDGASLTLDPVDPLLPLTDYTVAVSAQVRDRAGNPLVDAVVYDDRGRALGKNTHVLHRFRTTAEAASRPDAGVQEPDGSDADHAGAASAVLMTEILANPAGEEAASEYVEIWNGTAAPFELADASLDDRGGEGEGDRLAPCTVQGASRLEPGQAALLVGRAFVPPPDLAPGTPLLCGQADSLTSRGLKNSAGEVLVLRDGRGVEVCRYGGWVDMSGHEGCAAMRLDLAAADGPDIWAIPPDEPCRSPGRVP